MDSKLSFADLEVILRVVEAGSLSEAARQLGVEQSTLSRRLGKLEDALGEPLFVRGRQGAQPTPTAERLLPHARTAVHALAAAQRTGAPQRALAGRVRLAMPEGIAEHVISPHVAAFRERYPRLTLELVEGAGASDLHANEADLAVRLFKPSQATLVARRVGRAVHGVYGHREYCRGKQGARLEELDWVSFGGDTEHLPEARWLARRGIEPAVAARRFTTIVAAVRAGAGVCLLAHEFARLFPELEPLPLEEVPQFATDVWLVTTREQRHAPHVVPAWEMVESAFAQLQG